jgi:hypothetical protein
VRFAEAGQSWGHGWLRFFNVVSCFIHWHSKPRTFNSKNVPFEWYSFRRGAVVFFAIPQPDSASTSITYHPPLITHHNSILALSSNPETRALRANKGNRSRGSEYPRARGRKRGWSWTYNMEVSLRQDLEHPLCGRNWHRHRRQVEL